MDMHWRQLDIRRVRGFYRSPRYRDLVRQDSGALRRLEQEIKRPSGVLTIPTQHLPAIRYTAKQRVHWLRLPHLHAEMKPILISFAGAIGLMLLMVTIIVLVSHA